MLKSNILTIKEFLEKIDYKLYYTEAGQYKAELMPSNRIYVIPGYQREIRWKIEHVKVLIDDLIDEAKFLGIVLISTKDSKEYEIIDGQQRLTVIHLLIENLKKYSSQNTDIFFEQCPLNNYMFKQLDDIIDNNFFINNSKSEKEYNLIDQLNQFKNLKTIWKYIDSRIASLSDKDRIKLIEHLLDSEFNLILSVIGSKKVEERRICVDYFIDVNNKNVKLDSMDILKAYAFREDFDSVVDQWIKIQTEVNVLKSEEITYNKQAVFLHYFICCSNKYLNYQLSSIRNNFSIGNEVNLENETFPSGTPIEILIIKQGFYKEMFGRLNDFFDFLHHTKNCGGKPDNYFKQRIIKKNLNYKIDNDTIENIYTIINGIIRADEVVPKMLIMKYFFEIIDKKDAVTKEEIKSIYAIEILAAFFMASKAEKGKVTKQFDKLLLNENWIQMITERALALLNKFPANINYNKIIKSNGKITNTSGQYLAKRLYAIKAACIVDNNKKTINIKEKIMKKIYNEEGMNVEHFFINRNKTFSAFYGPDGVNRKKVSKIECPKNISNTIAKISNFLLIDEDVNTSLENHTIYDKISLLEQHFNNGEKIEKVFPDENNIKNYKKAKAVFFINGKYPKDKLSKCENDDEARRIVLDYYENDFMGEFNTYISRISEI